MQNQSLNQISMTLPVANNGVKYKQLSKCSIIVPDQNINKQKREDLKRIIEDNEDMDPTAINIGHYKSRVSRMTARRPLTSRT